MRRFRQVATFPFVFYFVFGPCQGHLRGNEEVSKSKRNKYNNKRLNRSLFFGNYFDIPMRGSIAPSSTPIPMEMELLGDTTIAPDFGACVGKVVQDCIQYIRNAWAHGTLDIQLASMCDPVTRDYRPDRITIFISGCHIPDVVANSQEIVIRKPGIG